MEGARLFLIDYRGAPAATAMILKEGDIGTAEVVAALPQLRQKGLGTAVVAAAVWDLKEQGVRAVTLRAEVDGVRIYQRVGFQVICQRVVASYPGV